MSAMSKKAAKKVAKKAVKKPASKPAKKPAKPVAKAAVKAKAKPAKSVAKKAASSKPAAKAAAPSTVMRDRAIAHAKFTYGLIQKFAAGFADDQVLAQPTGCPNHLLWTFGHLASTASWMNGLLTGGAPIVPENYNALFGMGSKPNSDAAAYPAFDEVKKAYENSFNAVIAAASASNDADLLKATEQDGGGFVNDKLDALTKIAFHDGWHIGQLADLRRGLGLPSVF